MVVPKIGVGGVCRKSHQDKGPPPHGPAQKTQSSGAYVRTEYPEYPDKPGAAPRPSVIHHARSALPHPSSRTPGYLSQHLDPGCRANTFSPKIIKEVNNIF
jgi:hypothetical protein